VPYSLRRTAHGYGVLNTDKGNWHSKDTTLTKAKAQLAILGAAEHGEPFATGEKPRMKKTMRMLRARKA